MDINKLMNENLINLNLKGETKLDVINELVELLDKEGRLLDKEVYFQDVLKREEIGSLYLKKQISCIRSVQLFKQI